LHVSYTFGGNVTKEREKAVNLVQVLRREDLILTELFKKKTH